MATHEAEAPSRPTTAAPGRDGTVVGLSWLIAVLALPATLVGVLWRGGPGSFAVTTGHGETVELYGQCLYRYDTLFTAGAAHGTDAVTLLLGIPLLVASTVLYGRGRSRWRLLHTGVLVYFLYVYAGAALGTLAFNRLFPLYVVLFSASLFATVLSFRSGAATGLVGQRHRPAPRRGLAAFLFASGVVSLAVWGLPLAAAVVTGEVPERLDNYTTEVTFALDLAVITPLTFVAGTLVLRRAELGYRLAISLLVLEALLAPMIAAQTVGQIDAGVRFQPGEVIGPTAGFVALAAGAAWFTTRIVRHLDPGSTRRVAAS